MWWMLAPVWVALGAVLAWAWSRYKSTEPRVRYDQRWLDDQHRDVA